MMDLVTLLTVQVEEFKYLWVLFTSEESGSLTNSFGATATAMQTLHLFGTRRPLIEAKLLIY